MQYPSNTRAVFYQISTDSALARSISDSYGLLVFISEVAWKKDYLGLLAFGFVATMRLLSNYCDLL